MEGQHPQSLEKRKLPRVINNKREMLLAIDHAWCSQRAFPQYLPPPKPSNVQQPVGAKEAWIELAALIHEDLTWLRKLPYHCFWSQVILDKSVILCLNSFLQEAPPVYSTNLYPRDVQLAIDKLTKVTFIIIQRLTTLKESKDDFLTPNVLGDILYENYIFTVPSMLDICVLYGISNREQVRNTLETITTVQPNYLNDFSQAVIPFTKVFLNLTASITEDNKNGSKIEDGITMLLDSVVSTRMFCEIFPKGCDIFTSTEVVSAIAIFYTTVLPNLAKSTNIQKLVSCMRVECLKFVNVLLSTLLANAMDFVDQNQKVDQYFSLIQEIMSESLFICDYNALYQLENDFDIIANICPDYKLDYLLEALASHTDIKPKKVEKPSPPVNHIKNYPGASNSQPASSSKSGKGAIEIMSLVSEVEDILPHLGSKFIAACLKYYDYDKEKVISGVLENTLPSNIEELDWTEKQAVVSVPERSNEFDFDEFDARTGAQVDKTRIYPGKKPRQHKNLNHMLSDKQEIKEMKDKFANLGYVADEYDDEYDDTYDSQDVAVKEPDAIPRPGRPFVVPRVLQTRENIEEEEEESSEDETAVAAAKKDHFITNPEELRARAEERRAQRGGRGGPRGGGGGGHRDVVGRSKGQGQDKEVLVNRQNKNTNKSGVANHHRRDRASKKRNQGMIPT